MKTSQLASTVSSRFVRRGHVIAVERDATRCETLKSMMAKSGADNYVRIIHDDFLKMNPNDFEDVEYILLDPTCSGSGMKVILNFWSIMALVLINVSSDSQGSINIFKSFIDLTTGLTANLTLSDPF